MKSIVYKGKEKFALEEMPKPVLEKGEVLIEVKYAGICGSDLFIWLGKHKRIKPNTILGHEFSGKIVEIKENSHNNSDNLKVGDQVAVRPNFYCGICDNCQRGFFHLCRHFGLYGIDADGGFAEYVKVKKENVLKTFNKVDYDELALVEPLSVALHAIRRSNFKLGDTVNILGGGPIGLLIASLLKVAGATKINIFELNPFRIKKAQEMGFATIDTSGKNMLSSDIYSNNETDIVFDTVGLKTVSRQLVKLVRTRGDIIIVGMYKELAEIDLLSMLYKEASIKAILIYEKEDVEKAVRLIDKHQIDLKPIITHKLPFEKIQECMEKIHDQEIDALKILLHP
jgi:(R,R)-butanediol dehydrogenase / meso-butanediol dehydrogenase / diacetyl reductase